MDNEIARQDDPNISIENIINQPDYEDVNENLLSVGDEAKNFDIEASDPLEKSENMIIAKEENLFKVSNPSVNQLNTTQKFIKAISIDFSLYLLQLILGAVILLNIHEEGGTSIKPFIDFILFFEVVWFFIKLIQYCTETYIPLKLYHHYRILQRFGSSCIYLGFSLYLDNEIIGDSLKLFVLPYCCICLLSILFLKQDRLFISNVGMIGDIFHVLQIFIVVSMWKEDSYYTKYMFFLVKGTVLKLLSYFFTIFGSMFLCFILIGRNNPPMDSRSKILIYGTVPLIFFSAWFGNLYFKFVDIGIKLINEQKITPINKEPIIDQYFYQKLVELFVFGSINFLTIIICYWYINQCFNDLRRSFPLKGITLATFAKDLRLRVKKISQYFFKFTKKSSYQDLEKNQSNSYDKELCYICCFNPNNIIIKPCGHSGVCKSCFLDYIKENEKCPLCKLPMEFAYYSYYNKKEGAFYAKQLVKIK